MHGRNSPFFLGTNRTGAPAGDLDLRMKPNLRESSMNF